jgi:hypothetical protein
MFFSSILKYNGKTHKIYWVTFVLYFMFCHHINQDIASWRNRDKCHEKTGQESVVLCIFQFVPIDPLRS